MRVLRSVIEENLREVCWDEWILKESAYTVILYKTIIYIHTYIQNWKAFTNMCSIIITK